jgi:DNA helicase HerA-like ATPase
MAETDIPAAVRAGYAFTGPALELGALVVGEGCDPTAKVRIPLSMVNRHGLVAGATGTGKTKTLQAMAEQLSAAGVPVFLADIKGDLSGMAAPGEASDRVTKRAADIGLDWAPAAYPVEFFALGGRGKGVPVRATVTSFGPTLLAKVLGLNDVQESSLGLVFHFADRNALPLLDLADLRAVIQHLTSPAGAPELTELGGLSKATAGVILRELIAFADAGAEDFFGETEFDTRDFLRIAPDGRGVVSILELPGVQDQPQLFATFLMWFLADLFQDLPEVGDVEQPKLVFFFDEAHLLFKDASKDFLAAITQTVRLIRSKGVGVFFVTQTPKDVPGDVLGQLGNRVQHALRAYTPEDAKALKATVSTFPKSGYDLEEVLTQLGTGEAVITVLSERGAPTPVAWTRLPPPRSLMAQVDATVADGIVAASPLSARYGARIDRESAYEMLLAKVAAPPPPEAPRPAPPEKRGKPERPAKPEQSFLEKALGNATVRGALRSAATAAGREIARSIFGTARKRR